MKTKIFLLLALIGFVSASCLGSSGPIGVLKTYDGGGAWQTADNVAGSSNQNISFLEVTEMAFNPSDHQQIFLTAVNGGLWRSDDSSDHWTNILSKIEAYDFALNPQDLKNIFVSGIFDGHGKIVRTRDGGASWEEVYNEASSNNPVRTIAINPANPQELYAGLDSGVVIKSIDGGTNWFVLKNFDDQLLKIRYDSHNNSLYALLHEKGLQKSTNAGVDWQNITTTLNLPGTDIFSVQLAPYLKIALDDTQAGVIYVTTTKGLFKTTDDGKSWFFINLPIQDAAQQPRAVVSSRGGLIAYTSIASTIFKTLDGGKSWQTQSLPTNKIVNKIIIDPVLPQVAYAGLINSNQ